jgi:putative membrane-bound dehydrogenase-like protein
MRKRLMAAVCLAVSTVALAAEPAAEAPAKPVPEIVPVGADGKPLNLDFETGTLQDWTAEGEAFQSQPVKGDTVFPRRNDNKSQHKGDYWIGGYEQLGDKPTGILKSAKFKVEQPWASFLVGGGPNRETRVELVRVEDELVVFTAGGWEQENLYPVVVDLRKHQGKDFYVRIVDEHTGHWGHINFDHFRLHPEKPTFPDAKPPMKPPEDVVKFAGLKADEAAKAATPPQGFTVTPFASEPEINQPVAMCIDARGRLWVAEAYGYPKRQPEGQGKDRIVILEDTDGDGKHDKRTVFVEGLNLVSGMEVGFGGVWVGAAPQMLFIPDKNGDDAPDGPAQVVLDGWGFQDTHETLNAFTWGPDGWMYGCHGVFTHSKVGKPGTPDEERVKINAGIWRYHPTKKQFEVFAEGTSNPWGVDFNDYGQSFATACVIPHLFHIIQGARYERQAGSQFNPHTYKNIVTIADHRHWAGNAGPHAGNNRSDAAGGGHAHCGAMIYLGDNWPASYRNSIFMANIHGNRINNDILEKSGSGYVGKHGADFMMMNDKWSRLINMKYGPDGAVYLVDWYDKQACHHTNEKIWDRTNGRIYKIAYGTPAKANVDLSKASDGELVKYLAHPNDWYVRMARRLLQERGNRPEVRQELAKALEQATAPDRRLRVLWAMHAVGALDEATILRELKHQNEYVRGWMVQLACEDMKPTDAVRKEMERLAKEDPSAVVRLYLASAAGRLPLEQRWETLAGLAGHAEDSGDQNLPQMVWYALEPLAAADTARALRLAATSKLPNLREYVARRAASK